MRLSVPGLGGLVAICLFAQDAAIRTTVPLVVVPASVTDQRGRFLEGLSPSEFVVLDDGKSRPAHVDVIDSGLAPVALVTVIQTSDISLSALGKIRKVGSMIPAAVVGANGEAAVVTFDDHVRVVQDFTRDEEAISKAFRDLKPADNTRGRMIDAVDLSLNMLASRSGARRANILLIAETKDRGSEGKLSNLIGKIQRTGVTIYSLSYSAYLTPFTTKPEDYAPPAGGGLLAALTETARLGKQNTVEALTSATGGRRFSFETKSKLENELIRLGTEIHSRYLISFTPEQDTAPKFHQLEVRITDHPEAKIQARPGYWSGLGASGQ